MARAQSSLAIKPGKTIRRAWRVIAAIAITAVRRPVVVQQVGPGLEPREQHHFENQELQRYRNSIIR